MAPHKHKDPTKLPKIHETLKENEDIKNGTKKIQREPGLGDQIHPLHKFRGEGPVRNHRAPRSPSPEDIDSDLEEMDRDLARLKRRKDHIKTKIKELKKKKEELLKGRK